MYFSAISCLRTVYGSHFRKSCLPPSVTMSCESPNLAAASPTHRSASSELDRYSARFTTKRKVKGLDSLRQFWGMTLLVSPVRTRIFHFTIKDNSSICTIQVPLLAAFDLPREYRWNYELQQVSSEHCLACARIQYNAIIQLHLTCCSNLPCITRSWCSCLKIETSRRHSVTTVTT